MQNLKKLLPLNVRKLAKHLLEKSLKAGFIACFFLLCFSKAKAIDQIWQFDSELFKIYNQVINLQTDQAQAQLIKMEKHTNELHRLYVLSLCETIDVLISEDEQKFSRIESNFKERFKYIEGLKESPETLFLEAELNLQRGFNFINLGQELNAVWAIRAAYNTTQECLKKYPDFIPIRKTSGVIQVMVGSVPDKFSWFMSLLGMKGSVQLGQKQLEELRQSKSSLSIEATILYYTIKGLINQQLDESSKGLKECLKQDPNNRLILFLAANLLIKNGQSEEALQVIHTLDKNNQGLPVHFTDYIRGDIHLQRGEYTQSIQAFHKFIFNYKSQTFKKDAYFKIALAYHLQGKPELAKASFEKAKNTGREVADPDKYAAAQLRENQFPNAKILKVRLSTDGGYYKEAKEEIHLITPADLVTLKDQTEFYYRKARLAHRMNELPAARLFYEQTIDMAEGNTWYFAPNSALQLGYIYQNNRDYAQARKYFELALGYKKHEYKESIDSKARAALERLPKK
jgi:tetratricopeptide (TPR) repeat protein